MPATGQRVSVTNYDPSDLKYGAINGQEGKVMTRVPAFQYDPEFFEVELDNFPGDPWVFYADELTVI